MFRVPLTASHTKDIHDKECIREALRISVTVSAPVNMTVIQKQDHAVKNVKLEDGDMRAIRILRPDWKVQVCNVPVIVKACLLARAISELVQQRLGV